MHERPAAAGADRPGEADRASGTAGHGAGPGAHTPAPPPARPPAPPGIDLELLVHGVGGATPEDMLADPHTVRVAGDDTAALFRRAADVHAEGEPGRRRDGRPVPEAYVWSNLTSGDGSRALWLLLLPFMVVNLVHWMRPGTSDRARTARLYRVLVRLAGLTLTVLLVAAACEVALDLTAWQCAGTPACAARHTWLGPLSPYTSGAGPWSLPGRRLTVAALVPTALTALLWYLSHRTWSAYESQRPPVQDTGTEPAGPAPARPGFWYGRRLVARLRAAHTAAGLLTVAAALAVPAARADLVHRARPATSGRSAVLAGRVLEGALLVAAAVVVAVVCRRGRSEDRPDPHLDRRLVRVLPLACAGLLLLAAGYAAVPRPDWHTAGQLPGVGALFGTLALAQCLLVVALGAVAALLHRRDPDPRAALHGLGGPAVAVLACALGAVMSGGVAQRVADWLDGTGTGLPGPPVLLTWQASVIPPVLLLGTLLAAVLAVRTGRLARRERPRVEADFAGAALDAERTGRIARVRAAATVTDRVPLVVGTLSAATLLLGVGALAGALTTGRAPERAARHAGAVVHGAVQVSQGLGSWLVGLGFVLLVTWGRRAYKDPAARRTVGILWDVGTFWPRAAHPFAPPCYAERAVPDLTWRVATWTRVTGGRIVLSGHSQGSVLAAAAVWQLAPRARSRVALLTYGSPLERLYGRWFPAHFGPAARAHLHREVACWRNLYRRTDPVGGPVLPPPAEGPEVDRPPLRDPLVYGRTDQHPLPAPVLGHCDYRADPALAEERARFLARLTAAVPGPRPRGGPGEAPGTGP